MWDTDLALQGTVIADEILSWLYHKLKKNAYMFMYGNFYFYYYLEPTAGINRG